MPSKTISLREETYHRLARAKGVDESFSDVIDRLLGAQETEHPLYKLVGLCEGAELDAIRKQSRTFRTEIEERLERDL